MSRLIIKGLPKKINEEKLRNLFGSKGTITDIQLKYTKDGVFRQFAFIGYQTDEQAQAALKHFNNTFIQTSRIKVESCAPLGSDDKPKAWSKYSKESSLYKKQHGEEKSVVVVEKEPQKEESDKKNKKKDRIDELLGKHKDDPKFIEFMQVHAKDRNVWENDVKLQTDDTTTEEALKKDKEPKNNTRTDKCTKASRQKATLDSQQSDDDSEKQDSTENEDDDQSSNENTNEENTKFAEKQISDLDYMKSLMKKSPDAIKTATKKSKTKKDIDLFTIKMFNIPYKVKRQEIIRFFKSVKPFSVRLPTNDRGFCFVGFKTEKEYQKAMLRNKSFIKGKQIFFTDYTEKNKISKQNKLQGNNANDDTSQSSNGKNSKWLKQEDALKNEEDISESGRIFFRNLAYTVNADEIQEIFEKYGPVADVSLPIDPVTRKIKGFGTVTFVMPEHAVRAFSELDGTLFHGRLLHLIPGKSKDNVEIDADEEAGLSFKQKKALKLKQSAGQSHNWNTLFLGSNVVADVLAKRFETSKETILDSNAGGSSAAVRLALGETQIVMEMRKFLEENDVQLNVFESAPKKRSKTVILAKNLPAETTVAELMPLFSKFGLLGRIVLPPSGVTALIEFLDPSEARHAFKKLAYSKFKCLPLYLEWAPEGTFKTTATTEISISKKDTEDNNEYNHKLKDENKHGKTKEIQIEPAEEQPEQPEAINEDDDEDPEPDTTLFLRNLNFNTQEDDIRKKFQHIGSIHLIQVARRKDPKNPRNKIALGYGFIQFKKRSATEKALKTMQFTTIEGNQVELKRSDRVLKSDTTNKNQRKSTNASKQTGTKMLVRNIPFQAKVNEVRDIFKAFGELKSVRLPKKMAPGEESHRGFGFVDFVTKSDAKKAFDALSQSTHLYGRRLVVEWASVDDDNVDELRKRTAQNFQGYDRSSKISKKSVFDTSAIESNADNHDDDGYR